MTLQPLGRRADGTRTVETILRNAADLASREGLDRLTIGVLAERLGMSKSGLFGHFGSKEELQLAAIEAAARRVAAAVLQPALQAPRGLARLEAACDRLIDYLAKPEFPGGCFFNMTRAEFHARPGAVRDAIAEKKLYWRRLLADLTRQAQALGEIAADIEPEQLAFELEAVMDAATWSVSDANKERELDHARRAVHRLLAQGRTQSGRGIASQATKRRPRRHGRADRRS